MPAPGYRHPLSIDPSGTWLGLAGLTALALLLVGTVRGLGRGSLRTLAAGIVVLGAALALVGIVQSGIYLHDPQKTGLVYGFWKPIFGTDPFGPFVNRNHFAGWMLLALPVAIGYFTALVDRGMRGVKPVLRERVLWFSSPDASRVILVGLAILVMGLSLVLTFSRSGISGFLLAVAISAGVVLRRRTQRSKRAVTLAYLVLLVVLTVSWVGFDALVGRFADAEDTELGGRLPIWSDTVKVVRDFPWTGTGLNTYGTSMLLYQEHNLDTHNVEAHNDYLQLAAEGGRAARDSRRLAAVRPGSRNPSEIPRTGGRHDGILAARRRDHRPGRHRAPGDGGVQPADAGHRGAVRRRGRDRHPPGTLI